MSDFKLVIVPRVDQTWNVLDIARRCPPIGWSDIFKNAEPELEEVSEILSDMEQVQGPYYPLKHDIFRAFDLTPLSRVRVVIFGQDPYHDRVGPNPRAQGLSFSVSREASIPPSLRNIFLEIRNEYPEYIIPHHGDLTHWADQGVLLLNSCLTVTPSSAGSHGKLWRGFVIKMIAAINKTNPNCVWVLWGAKAQELTKYIGQKPNVLMSAHPSPFSAKRGFFGNGHFRSINDILTGMNQAPIDWSLPVIDH